MRDTFAAMTRRRMVRRKEGLIEYTEARTLVTIISIAIAFVGFVNAAFPDEAPVSSSRFDVHTNLSFGTLGLLCLLSLRTNVSARTVLRLLVLALIASLLAMIACIHSYVAVCTSFDLTITHITMFCVLSLVVFDLLRFAMYKRLARSNALDTTFWWSVERDDDRWLYRPELWILFTPFSSAFMDRFLSPRRCFHYEGELDNDQPSGEGQWFDTAKHGEILKGRWKDGKPIAPFRSYDYTTGYAFEAVCVGVVHNRAEEIHEYWYSVVHGPLQWAVSGVECSIAGKFYRNLPDVTLLESAGHDERDPVSWCLNRMPGLHEKYALDPLDSEVVLFIHGFNSPVSDALARIGQLWTLGAFPNYLRPIVFGWPGSRDVCYFSAIRSAGSARVVCDFERVVRAIQLSGVKKVHILCHSLGAQILFNVLRRETNPFADIELCTVVLINPDSPLESFLARDYEILHAQCANITVYADHLDGALWYSEFFNRTTKGQRIKSLGRRPFDLLRSTNGAIECTPLDLDVIEVSWMDHNMHGMRHNFFDINRFVVSDLCEIFSSAKRACERTSLLHRHSNVYSFLNAPKHIVH